MQGSQPLVEELSNIDAAVTVLAPTNAGLALEQVDDADVRLPCCPMSPALNLPGIHWAPPPIAASCH